MIYHSYPAWSPGGWRIADSTLDDPGSDFVAVRAFRPRSARLSRPLSRDDATGELPCAERPQYSDTHGLAWSPDGTTLAYGLLVDDRYHVCLEPAMGGEVVSPVESAAPVVPGSWAPQGGYLVVEDGRTGTGDIMIMDAATGDVAPVTSGPASDSSPEWIARSG